MQIASAADTLWSFPFQSRPSEMGDLKAGTRTRSCALEFFESRKKHTQAKKSKQKNVEREKSGAFGPRSDLLFLIWPTVAALFYTSLCLLLGFFQMQPPHPRPYDSQSASPYPRFHGPGPTSQPPPIPQHQPGAFRDAPTAPYPYNVSHSGPIPPSFQPYVRVNNSPSSTPNGLPPFPPPTSSPSHHNLPPPMPLPPISKKRKSEDDAVPPAPNYPPRLQGGPNYSYPLHHLPPPAPSGQTGVSAASPFTGSDSLPRGMMPDASMQDSHKKAKFSPPSHSASTPRPPSPPSDAELNGLLLEIHKEMKDMKDANKDLWRAHASLKDDIKEFERLNFASSDISNASSSSSRSAYGPPFSSSTSAPSQHSQGPPPLPLASPSSYPHKPTPHHAPAPQQPQQPQPPSQPQSLKKLSPIPAQSLFQKFYTTLSQTQQPVQPLQPRLPSMSPQQPQPQQPQPQQPQQPPLHHSQPPQHAQTKQQPPPPRFAEFGRGEDLFQRFSARSAAMSTGSNGTETNPLHHGNLTSDGGRMMKDMHADREEARERERERERERDRERERGREREQREREHKEREAERYREQQQREQQQRNQRELLQQQQEQREQQRQRDQSRSQDIFEMLGIANFGGEVAMGIAGVADSRYISVNEAFCRLFGYTQVGNSFLFLPIY